MKSKSVGPLFDFTAELSSAVRSGVSAGLAADLVGRGRTSYPESRHLVGFCPENAVQHSVLDLVESGQFTAFARPGFDRELPAGEFVAEDWLDSASTWQTAVTLREALSDHDARLCADCAVEGRVLQHSHSDRQRLAPYRCQQRAVCPACGLAYGKQRGGELVELLDAVLSPGRLLLAVPEVAAWHFVQSCDSRVSMYVADLADAGDVVQLRKVIASLTEDVHASVRAVFGPGVAAVVAWHWWHSDAPAAAGLHLHAHVTVPNVSVTFDEVSGAWRPDYAPLRVRGVLSADELSELAVGFGVRVCRRRWCKKLGLLAPCPGRQPSRQHWQPNVHARFTTERGGHGGFAHRLRYDARTSIADLLACMLPDLDDQVERARLLGESQLGDLVTQSSMAALFDGVVVDIAEFAALPDVVSRFLHRASIFQRVQLVRYTGWLVNSARKSLGLVRGEAGESEWSGVGLYRVLGLHNEYLFIERACSFHRDATGWAVEAWHADHVDLMPQGETPRGFTWLDEVRPVRTGGPPRAWLEASGFVNAAD